MKKLVLIIAVLALISAISFTNNAIAAEKKAKATVSYNGGAGTFKIEMPQPGWEYDGPMDLPIVTIDKHYYENSKCTPSFHQIECPGEISAILQPSTKVVILNHKLDRDDLILLNGKRVVVIGKTVEKKDSKFNSHLYWTELTILVGD